MYRFEKAYLKKNKYFGGKMKILDLSFVKAYMWEYWVSIQYYIFKNININNVFTSFNLFCTSLFIKIYFVFHSFVNPDSITLP